MSKSRAAPSPSHSRLLAQVTGMIVGTALCMQVAASPETTSSAPILTLAMARRVFAAAEAEASRKGWPCVIAVVDRSGYVILLERMDGSPMLASVELAPAKARTSALFAKPTQALEDAIKAGRVAAVTAGYVEMAGGEPLLLNGQLLGVVGVSSAQPQWDVDIADAAVAALSVKAGL